MSDSFPEVHDRAHIVLPGDVDDSGFFDFARIIEDSDFVLGREAWPFMRTAPGAAPNCILLTRALEVEMSGVVYCGDVVRWSRQLLGVGSSSVHTKGVISVERRATGLSEEVGRAFAVIVTGKPGRTVPHGRAEAGSRIKFNTQPWFDGLPAHRWERRYLMEHQVRTGDLNYIGTLSGSRSAALSATAGRIISQTVLVSSNIRTILKFVVRREQIVFERPAPDRGTINFIAEIVGMNETSIAVRVKSHLQGTPEADVVTDARVLLCSTDRSGAIVPHGIAAQVK